jgi:hypothetical protein
MSFVDDLMRASGVLLGAAAQAVNVLTGRILLPIPILPSVPVGDVLETAGSAARTGADAVERIVDLVTGDAAHRVDENAARGRRPLLLQSTVQVVDEPGAITTIAFDARVDGVDWQRAGAESERVAVYVDGRYHSTVTVLAERPGSYVVNLAGVPAGARAVELRHAADTSRRGPAAATSLQVTAMQARRVEGETALVQRHAPIVELRDQDRGAGHSAAHSDTPLLLVPAVTRHADGSRTIAYRVAFSNEEGGTPSTRLLSRYGRTADLEPIYRVRVAADGRVLEASYQAALHQWRTFTGDRFGDRPLLRVATANSNFSVRVRGAGDGAERWSEAAIDAVAAETSDYEVMHAHPWTWTVMAKELLREGKSVAADAVRGRHQVGDPRRYLYVGPLSDAVRGAIQVAGGIHVRLADGSRTLVRVVPGFATGGQGQGALELPPGVLADAIRGVDLLGVRATVLDERLRARELEPLAA